MSKCIVFEDGNIINSINEPALWDGLFSKMLKDGEIMQFIQQNLHQAIILYIFTKIMVQQEQADWVPVHRMMDYLLIMVDLLFIFS